MNASVQVRRSTDVVGVVIHGLHNAMLGFKITMMMMYNLGLITLGLEGAYRVFGQVSKLRRN